MNVAIITNITKDRGLVAARKAASCLKGKADIYMSDDCLLPEEFGVKYVPYSKLWQVSDIVLVIGGDGTLLRVASNCASNGIPALGINLGKVGFLTEVEPDEMQNAIDSVISGNYKVEKRMLLNTRINGGDISCHALNDIVISKPEGIKLIGLDLYTDNELVNHYVADGLIIATPTGSTGYSISAGGPVVDPRMSLYVATPICAHMLSVRSAILPAERDIVIRLNGEYPDSYAIICIDGEKRGILRMEDEVRIMKSKYEFELIRIGTSSFYNTLISKL